MARLGIIGGSGVYHLPELADSVTQVIDTPYGAPSGEPRLGNLGQLEVVFIPRHGYGHTLSPTNVPYRANVYAMKALGVSHLLSVSAVGSLAEELPPRTPVMPDQLVDRTVARANTFFDREVVAHVGLADPYCSCFRRHIVAEAAHGGIGVHLGGTYICIEGPQFSTRAESQLYRAWGGAVIGMTAMPEARLAREAELCYATLAMVTDYDVWHETEADVTVETVMSHLEANNATSGAILRAIGARPLPGRDCACGDALRDAMMTGRDWGTDAARARLGAIIDRYLPAAEC